jgi:hypothetical protein
MGGRLVWLVRCAKPEEIWRGGPETHVFGSSSSSSSSSDLRWVFEDEDEKEDEDDWNLAVSGLPQVAAGLPACRRGWHPATRKRRRICDESKFLQAIRQDHTESTGLEARFYVSQDG